MISRFAIRYYYETKFIDEDLPLWLWDTETTREFEKYEYKTNIRGLTFISKGEKPLPYSNSLFKPADLYSLESTPNYFIVDIYGISAGGYASYKNHKRKKHFQTVYDDYYSAGGSGGTIYMAGVKIRIKDEELKPIVYTMTAKASPINPSGGDYDWSRSPANVYTDTNDWCLKLSEKVTTPTGIAPAGLTIIGMASGGNAYISGSPNYPGNGAAAFYIPEQCAFPANIDDLRKYEPDEHFNVGDWFNYDNKAYKTITEFTVDNWERDSGYAQIAKTYTDTQKFVVGEYLYYDNNLYHCEKEFTGDYMNTILGFADYLLDKSEMGTLITQNGNTGRKVKDSPHSVEVTKPNRIFTEDTMTEINETWVKQTLSWGAGQGVDGRRQGIGAQGGGIVVIYKGESA